MRVLVRFKRMWLLASRQFIGQAAQAPHVDLLTIDWLQLNAFGRWNIILEVNATRSEGFLFSKEHGSSHIVKFGLLADTVNVFRANTSMDYVKVVQCFDSLRNTVKDIRAELL